MEDGTSTVYMAVLFPLTLLFGWILGHLVTWSRLRRPLGRVSGDGGIEYLLDKLDHTAKRGSDNRSSVQLTGVSHGASDDMLYVSVTVPSASPLAEELDRVHSAGAMFCSLRPGEKRRNVKDTEDRPPISVVPDKEN